MTSLGAIAWLLPATAATGAAALWCWWAGRRDARGARRWRQSRAAALRDLRRALGGPAGEGPEPRP